MSIKSKVLTAAAVLTLAGAPSGVGTTAASELWGAAFGPIS